MRPSTFPTQSARLAYFREQLATKPNWALRALMVVYEKQTSREKAEGVAADTNGVGFNGQDAQLLTAFAQQVERWDDQPAKHYASPLSPRQMAVVMRRMKKYASQIIDHMGSKAPAVVKIAKVA